MYAELEPMDPFTDDDFERYESNVAAMAEGRDIPQPAAKAQGDPVGSDSYNAHRLLRALSGKALYNPSTNTWYVFDGRTWQEDVGALRLEVAAADVASDIQREMQRAAGGKKAQVVVSQRALKAMIDACKRDATLWVSDDQWDADGDLLACPNGTLNIRTGEFGRANPAQRLRRIAGVDYDADAKAPRWERFINEVTGNDRDLADYLHRFAGYALLGRAPERAVHISYGSGSNGKSVFFDAVSRVMGTYVTTLGAGALLAQRDNGGDRPRADLLQLPGARLAIANELPKGAGIDERLLKSLASGGIDRITVRGMYARTPVTFVPVASIAIVTNHRPMIEGSDAGIWERLRVIPWSRRFVRRDELPNEGASDSVGVRDPELESDLIRETPGIMRWMIEGAKRYLDEGLPRCEAVIQASKDYRDECDAVGSFVAWCCEIDPTAEEKTVDLYNFFAHWAKGQDYPSWPRMQEFVARLEGTPGVSRAVARVGDGPARQRSQARVIRGIRLARNDFDF